MEDAQSSLETLSPRRREIVEIIKEQQMVSFDFIYRRFLFMSRRQIAYDLEYLVKLGYITKMGVTRGAVYGPRNSPI